MMSEPLSNRSALKIMVATLVLAALGYLFYPVPGTMTLPLMEPLRPDRPSPTYYAGAASLDVPDSFKLDSLKAIFYHIDPSDKTATITVSEWPWAKRNKRPYQAPSLDHSYDRHDRKLEEVDLAAKFNRPAKLYAFYTDRYVFPATLLKPSSPADQVIAKSGKLVIILKIEEPWGILEFKYIRALDQSQTENSGSWWVIGLAALVEQAQTIYASYQWLGSNEFQAEPNLVMEVGHLVPGENGRDWKVDFQAKFIPSGPPEPSVLIPTLTVEFEGFSEEPTKTADSGRLVGGHRGKETRQWVGRPRNNFQRIFKSPKLRSLELSWEDGSGRNPTTLTPNCRARLDDLFLANDPEKVARFLGVWDSVLNSIQLPPPAADPTDSENN